MQKKEETEHKSQVYRWVVNEASIRDIYTKKELVFSIRQHAHDVFGVAACAPTIYKILWEGREEVQQTGPKGNFLYNYLMNSGNILQSYIGISEITWDGEVINNDIVTLLKKVVAIVKNYPFLKNLWNMIKAAIQSDFSVDKEILIELQWQQWTT